MKSVNVRSSDLSRVIHSGRNESIVSLCHLISIVFCIWLYAVLGNRTTLVLIPIFFFIYTACVIKIRKSGIVHLDLVFMAFLMIYSVSLPISASFISKEYDIEILGMATLLSMLAYFGFGFGVFLNSGTSRVVGSVTYLDRKYLSAYRWASFIVFFLGVLLTILAIALTTGFSSYLSAGYAGRSLIKQEVGPIEIGLYVAITGLLAIFVTVLLERKNSPLTSLIIASTFLFFFAYISFLGIRRPLFLLLLGMVSAYSLIRHEPGIIKSVLLMIAAFIFFTTFSQYRQDISSHGLDATLTFVNENASLEWLDVSETELGAPFRSLYDYLERYQDHIEYRLGYTYLETLPYVLPSFVTGGIPSLSVEYTHAFFSRDFIAIGGNMGFFPVTEAYLNFGGTGCLVVFVVIGVGLSRINRFFHSAGRSKVIFLTLFAVSIPWCAFFMRLDFASFTKGFLYSQLVPLFSIYVIAVILRASKDAV